MKCLFALYDKNDVFITCGFSLIQMRKFAKQYGAKTHLFRISCEVQNDIFEEEDREFIKIERQNVFTNKELALEQGVSIRTIFRHKAKRENNER